MILIKPLKEVVSYPDGLCLHPNNLGASRVVSEDPTNNLLNLLWFPAHSSHVYISITTNSVENTTLKVYKLQLGVYVSVNWKINFIFERFYAYSEVIIKKFTL